MENRGMPNDPRYLGLQRLLSASRQSAGLTQSDVAAVLGKPQSFVSKYESGERTLDVIEFLDVCRSIACDPLEALKALGSDDE